MKSYYDLVLETAVKKAANQERSRRKLVDFTLYTKPNYRLNWHHSVLGEHLDKVRNGEIMKLMVFMPPQHGKSELVSRRFPAQYLGQFPDTNIVVASYSDAMASSFNRSAQRIMDTWAYNDVYPNIFLSDSTLTKVQGNFVRNTELAEIVSMDVSGRFYVRGSYRSVGVRGALTGNPADVLIIDDPIKDRIEASSPTYKEQNWSWYNDVAETRLHNRSKQILCMTRWASDDLAGRILDSDPDWTVLYLPAIKEDNDNKYDPREIGQALWEEHLSVERARKIQAKSPRTFAALYQQKPKPVQTGGEFYYCFDYAKHTGTCEYNPELPLHVSFDFNVVPYMTMCIWQLQGKKARQIAEICLPQPRSTSLAVCTEFERKLAAWGNPNHDAGLFIYGDPQGLKQSTAEPTLVRVVEQQLDEFSRIIKYLSKYRPTRRINRAYPPVRLRGEFVNTIFESNYGDIEVTIDKRCIKTIEDYQYVKTNADGTKLVQEAKDPNSNASYEVYGHTSDANDYLICEAFKNDLIAFKSVGKGNGISMGKMKRRGEYE